MAGAGPLEVTGAGGGGAAAAGAGGGGGGAAGSAAGGAAADAEEEAAFALAASISSSDSARMPMGAPTGATCGRKVAEFKHRRFANLHFIQLMFMLRLKKAL